MDVAEFRIGEDLGGVRRHLSGGVTDVGHERDQGDRAGSQARTRYAALSLVSMTLVASIFDEKALAVFSVAGARLGQRVVK